MTKQHIEINIILFVSAKLTFMAESNRVITEVNQLGITDIRQQLQILVLSLNLLPPEQRPRIMDVLYGFIDQLNPSDVVTQNQWYPPII